MSHLVVIVLEICLCGDSPPPLAANLQSASPTNCRMLLHPACSISVLLVTVFAICWVGSSLLTVCEIHSLSESPRPADRLEVVPDSCPCMKEVSELLCPRGSTSPEHLPLK